MRKLFLIIALFSSLGWSISAPINCQGKANTASLTITITSFVFSTPGDGVFVWAGKGSVSDTVTITDNGSGGSQTYTQVGSYSNAAASGRGALFVATNVTSALNGATITATWAASTTAAGLVACEIPGLALSSPTDATVNSTCAACTSLTSGSLTTNNANDLLLYCLGTGLTTFSAPVAGSGYTLVTGTGLPSNKADCQYQVVSSTQSSITTSISWTTSAAEAVSLFAGLKAASGTVTNQFPQVYGQ